MTVVGSACSDAGRPDVVRRHPSPRSSLAGADARAAAAAETQPDHGPPTLLGEYHLTFDDQRCLEADVQPLVDPLAAPGRLEQPGGGAAAGALRGGRDRLPRLPHRSPQSPTFLWNARVNLERGTAALTHLRACGRRRARSGGRPWLQRSLAFSLWLEETKLEFFRSGRRDRAAPAATSDIDPARGCAAALKTCPARRGVRQTPSSTWSCSPGTTASTTCSAAGSASTRWPPGSASSPRGESRSASSELMPRRQAKYRSEGVPRRPPPMRVPQTENQNQDCAGKASARTAVVWTRSLRSVLLARWARAGGDSGGSRALGCGEGFGAGGPDRRFQWREGRVGLAEVAGGAG